MFDRTLRNPPLGRMAEDFTVSTGRLSVLWRGAFVAVAAFLAIQANVGNVWRTLALLALPTMGVAAATLHAYPKAVDKLANSRIPVLNLIATHLANVSGRATANFAGVAETLGALTFVLLVGGPLAVRDLPPGVYLIVSGCAVAFAWSVGRGIMLDWSWYQPGAAPSLGLRLFRYGFPTFAALVVGAILFSSPLADLRLGLGVLAAGGMLSLYALVLHYERSLRAAQHAIESTISFELEHASMQIHSLVKNPFYLLMSAIDSRDEEISGLTRANLREIFVGVEEARLTVLNGGYGRSARVADLVAYVSGMFPMATRQNITLDPSANVDFVFGRDYAITRCLLMDLVTNAIRGGAGKVAIRLATDQSDSTLLTLVVKDDIADDVIIPTDSAARTSMQVIREHLRYNAAGNIEIKDRGHDSKSVVATWRSMSAEGK